MDYSDFWTTHLAAAKLQFNLQNHLPHAHYQSLQLDSWNVDDSVVMEEEEEEEEEEFPCPYCYQQFDIPSLCSHLRDHHSSQSKPTIFCPICSVKVTRDMLTHITLQHGHLLKLQRRRRRRLRRDVFPGSHALALLGRDHPETHIQLLQRGSTYRSNNAVSDPFISSLVMNFPSMEAEEISKTLASTIEDTSENSSASQSQHMWKLRFDPLMNSEEREKRVKQAVFVQDLLASTLSIN